MEVLSVFLDLLRHGKTNPNPRFILTPTAVAHTFCRNHNGCETYTGIRDIVEFLETELMEQLGLDSEKRVVRERVIIIIRISLSNKSNNIYWHFRSLFCWKVSEMLVLCRSNYWPNSSSYKPAQAITSKFVYNPFMRTLVSTVRAISKPEMKNMRSYSK